ncbi:MAG: LysM domain-containing protein [Turicibacter sp.]|nr:LysM domain-containing protein [Turicibacter sp.]
MKLSVVLLTLFLVACGGDEEVNVVEPEDNEVVEALEEVPADDKLSITGDRYIIRVGDTLSDIAQMAGINLETLMRWNVITDPNAIFVGEEIVLSGAPVIEYADAIIANVVMDTNNYLNSLGYEDAQYFNPSFLNAMDLEALYLLFLREGGEPRNISAFAKHLFEHAPLLSNWQELAMTIYSPLGVNAFEPVPGRPGYYYAINSTHSHPLVGIINARTGVLEE